MEYHYDMHKELPRVIFRPQLQLKHIALIALLAEAILNHRLTPMQWEMHPEEIHKSINQLPSELGHKNLANRTKWNGERRETKQTMHTCLGLFME